MQRLMIVNKLVEYTIDFRLRSDRTMCISGPSQSGKTTFLKRLLT